MIRFGVCQEQPGCYEGSGLDGVTAGAGRLVGRCGLGWTGLSKVVTGGQLSSFAAEMDKFTG